MTQRIRAVVFDLDGLIFNTEDLYQHVGSLVLRRRGKNFDDDLLDQMMGRQPKIALQMMIDYHDLNDSVEQLALESEEVFREILDERLELMPGFIDLMQALEQATIPKAVATSSGRDFTSNVLGRFNLQQRFEFILTSEDVRQGKPEPEVYLTAAQRFGVDPSEMLVLEDSQNGCRAAIASGAFAVAVPTGRSRSHEFDGAALIADTLADRRIYESLGL